MSRLKEDSYTVGEIVMSKSKHMPSLLYSLLFTSKRIFWAIIDMQHYISLRGTI